MKLSALSALLESFTSTIAAIPSIAEEDRAAILGFVTDVFRSFENRATEPTEVPSKLLLGNLGSVLLGLGCGILMRTDETIYTPEALATFVHQIALQQKESAHPTGSGSDT